MEDRKRKTCDYCGSSFNIRTKGSGGSNRRFCYTCLPENLSRRERSDLRTQLLVKMNSEYKLALGCQRCGYKNLASALEWHHTENDKAYEPSLALKSSWYKYLQECAKCTLLCANCHREVHAGL